ncbi:MAG: DUF885 family protein [Proteobacteria bacterium]|nr:DUF885 family protein [Pseudomonadota bacterium]
MQRPLTQIAGDYFDYLGRHFPQQCASDEFYFFPRSEAALQHLDGLDELIPERIHDHLRTLSGLLKEVPSDQRDELEGDIDRLLLRQSMKSVIRELQDAMSWQNDPILYIKIPLFATDHILYRKESPPDRLRVALSNLLSHIPPFLDAAINNLCSLSEISVQVALDMAEDARQFYSRDLPTFIAEKIGGSKELFAKSRTVSEAWDGYKRGLLRIPFRESFAIGEDNLKRILAISFGYPKSPREILKIARQAYREIHEKIRQFAGRIDSRKSWNRILYEQLPLASSPEELLRLYQREVVKLRRFLTSQDILTFPTGEKIAVLQTPSYLQSLRATASYRAPLTGDTRSHGVFYVTPGKEDLQIISTHCPYLSAHESYPGHHILDHFRIHHDNPIRRQIESPLFYEGWATYAEQLLDELGYVRKPRQQLVQLKRQLWRNLRAVLDVELQTKKTSLVQAAEKVRALGFSPERAYRQVRRFALTPGYQLCYFMGAYEIARLRKQFGPPLGLRTFHDTLLGGGEIPFHLVQKRLEAYRDGEASP